MCFPVFWLLSSILVLFGILVAFRYFGCFPVLWCFLVFICTRWCLLSVFLIYCSDEWKKLVNLIYCFQVLFRMNFKIMYFLMKILGNTPSADSAASRDSLSSQNATWGIVFFSSFYWWHIEYKGWMCERLLNLQEVYVSFQNICIEVYGNSDGTITPLATLCTRVHRAEVRIREGASLVGFSLLGLFKTIILCAHL